MKVSINASCTRLQKDCCPEKFAYQQHVYYHFMKEPYWHNVMCEPHLELIGTWVVPRIIYAHKTFLYECMYIVITSPHGFPPTVVESFGIFDRRKSL